MRNYDREAEQAYDQYTDRVLAICEAIRADLVVSYCDRNRLRFCSGMGSWVFFRERDDKQVGPIHADFPFERDPGYGGAVPPHLARERVRKGVRRLNAALTIPFEQIDYGCMIRDYTPTDWKGK